MRITHEMLLKVAQDTVEQRTRADRSIEAAYLYGSVLGPEPLLGGTTDVDLFFIHDDDVAVEREFIRITDDVHLDIVHSSRRAYRQVRELRLHPWLGPTLYHCRILYDPQHFLDFVQASVRGQYESADHVLERARPLAEQARQIWFSFDMGETISDVEQVRRCLKALECAANAIALLTGDPLPERRFLLNFPSRAQAVGRPGLMAGLVGLLGGSFTDRDGLQLMNENWKKAFEQAQRSSPPPDLSTHRKRYYERALEAFIAGEQFQLALWPLISTWTRMIEFIYEDTPERLAWRHTCQQLGFLGDGFAEKLQALDAFMDMVEETLEQWAQANGA